MIYLIFIGWLACGFAAAGVYYADLQRSYPDLAKKNRREDAWNAVFVGVEGPIGLLAALLNSGFAEHGWKIPGTK